MRYKKVQSELEKCGVDLVGVSNLKVEVLKPDLNLFCKKSGCVFPAFICTWSFNGSIYKLEMKAGLIQKERRFLFYKYHETVVDYSNVRDILMQGILMSMKNIPWSVKIARLTVE